MKKTTNLPKLYIATMSRKRPVDLESALYDINSCVWKHKGEDHGYKILSTIEVTEEKYNEIIKDLRDFKTDNGNESGVYLLFHKIICPGKLPIYLDNGGRYGVIVGINVEDYNPKTDELNNGYEYPDTSTKEQKTIRRLIGYLVFKDKIIAKLERWNKVLCILLLLTILYNLL